MTIFQLFYEMKLKTSKSCHFEASKDIITKFKSQALHIIRIKYWKTSGSGNPPSLSPALLKIAILGLKMKFSTLFCTRLYVNVPFLFLSDCQEKESERRTHGYSTHFQPMAWSGAAFGGRLFTFCQSRFCLSTIQPGGRQTFITKQVNT